MSGSMGNPEWIGVCARYNLGMDRRRNQVYDRISGRYSVRINLNLKRVSTVLYFIEIINLISFRYQGSSCSIVIV